ncbi:MAG: hypothetical protein QOE38_190 [Thermoleophilaceae bacterium]|nr:hypothetical protein [Thermoleophilaceae bacterium]
MRAISARRSRSSSAISSLAAARDSGVGSGAAGAAVPGAWAAAPDGWPAVPGAWLAEPGACAAAPAAPMSATGDAPLAPARDAPVAAAGPPAAEAAGAPEGPAWMAAARVSALDAPDPGVKRRSAAARAGSTSRAAGAVEPSPTCASSCSRWAAARPGVPLEPSPGPWAAASPEPRRALASGPPAAGVPPFPDGPPSPSGSARPRVPRGRAAKTTPPATPPATTPATSTSSTIAIRCLPSGAEAPDRFARSRAVRTTPRDSSVLQTGFAPGRAHITRWTALRDSSQVGPCVRDQM